LTISAQLQTLKGQIIANDDVEGIHILNKTALKYTVTDTDGSFQVLAKANDTLTISSLKYETKALHITNAMLNQNDLKIYLQERVNELDEVVLGTILTGSLSSDLGNLELEEPINFYDLGIPGYTGKHKTLGERKLAEATSGGGGIPLFPILNAITGRTKQLKKELEVERDIKCLEDLKTEYLTILFDENEISSDYATRFFSYATLSEQFRTVCRDKSKLRRITFLQTELETFKTLNKQDD